MDLAIDIHGSIEKSQKAASKYQDSLRRWYNDYPSDWAREIIRESSRAYEAASQIVVAGPASQGS